MFYIKIVNYYSFMEMEVLLMIKKHIKKLVSIVLSAVMVIGMSTTAFAATPMTLEEAKEYLSSYNVTKTNAAGKEYTTQYVFDSESDLNKAAAYIVEHGLDNFNNTLDVAISEAVSKEPQSTLAFPRTTDPTTAYETVSGNGNHYVSAESYGLASFDTLGTVEYSVELGYRVTVSNGKFTNLTSISFDIPYISAAGSWGSTTFPSYCNDTNCGVTANYLITKTVEVGLGDFSFEVKSETDNEIFALLTSLN
jgi:hypothetical protein